MRGATLQRHFFTVALLFCLTSPARAELNGTYTVEALTCASDVIVVGELTDFIAKQTKDDVTFEGCTLRVTEVIKGSAGPELTSCHTLWPWQKEAAWRTKGRGLLVMLRHATEQDDRHLRRQLIPVEDRDPLSIVDLASLRPTIYDRGLRVKTRGELLVLVREWAPKKIAHSLHRDADFESEAFRELETGSGVWLFVPAEEKYRALFLRQARAPEQWDRVEAARELWKFPGPTTEQALRELVEDVSDNVPDTGGELTTASFPVRTEAMESLKKLGLTTPDLPVERTIPPAERSKLRALYWMGSLRQSLPNEWQLLSVTDGPTRKIHVRDGSVQDETVLQVEVEKERERYRIELVPLWWPPEDFPSGRRLGEDMAVSNRPRIFFCDPALPAAVQTALVRRYQLVEPKWLREEWAKKPAERDW